MCDFLGEAHVYLGVIMRTLHLDICQPVCSCLGCSFSVAERLRANVAAQQQESHRLKSKVRMSTLSLGAGATYIKNTCYIS
jgi:hypothetical protein